MHVVARGQLGGAILMNAIYSFETWSITDLKLIRMASCSVNLRDPPAFVFLVQALYLCVITSGFKQTNQNK